MFSYIPCDEKWTASYPNSSRSCGYEELGMLCDWRDTNGGASEKSTTAALTDRTRWACSNLAYNPPRLASNAFYNFLDTPMKVDELPRQVVHPPRKNTPPKIQQNTTVFGIDQAALQEADDLITQSRNIKESYACNRASSTMLPVTDYRHNIRECIKNMILLEDHLCHPEKRCTDCCQKHFLFLEGLAEEARTLDTSGRMSDDMFQLPGFYRSIASDWASIDPASATANEEYAAVMQKLRTKRKALQDGYFTVSSNGAACSNGVCYNA